MDWFFNLPLVEKVGWSVLGLTSLGVILIAFYFGFRRFRDWQATLEAEGQEKVAHQALIGAIILVAVIVIFLILWKVPEWQVNNLRNVPNITKKEIFEQENEARKTVAQIIGGFALLIGIYFTWRRIAATERNLEIAQDGQITERFTRAIEQLGNDKLEVRIGGIYALERIARDSEKDHWPIMEVLTAYVRKNATWPPQKPEGRQELQGSPSDIQAIIAVLRRRENKYEKREDQRLDLRETDLRGADFKEAHLKGANLYKANLGEADLRMVNLKGANLTKAGLWQAKLREAQLEEAKLVVASLGRADLYKANLKRANLMNAHLERADLGRTNLEGAELSFALLKKADLVKANLEGVELGYANLEEANLVIANLDGANLVKANLERADLWMAHLKEAKLGEANLKGANLSNAHLEGADLGRTNLEGAKLYEANLEGANLMSAHLEEANLQYANFQGARNLEKDQVIRAKCWPLASFDASILETLGLPPDHNFRSRWGHLGGYNLAGADLRGARLGISFDLKQANLKGAHLEGAELEGARGLTEEQILSAYYDENTKLPDYLKHLEKSADSKPE